VKRLLILPALVAALLATVPVAGAATVLTGPTNMSADRDGDNEVDVAINPTNPKNLVAAWNDYGSDSCGIGTSYDGGKTWRTDYLHGIDFATYDYGAGDPSVGFLDDGTAVTICNAWQTASKPTAIYFARSTDGGTTWSPSQIIAYAPNQGKNLDHPLMTIDRYGDRVLVGYSVWNGFYVARSYGIFSSDAGRTWSAPAEIAARTGVDAILRAVATAMLRGGADRPSLRYALEGQARLSNGLQVPFRRTGELGSRPARAS